MRHLFGPALVIVACGVTHADEDPTKTELRANLIAARSLDIDYRKCAAVVLLQEIGELGTRRDDTVYVSIIGEDPDQATLESLRQLPISVRPASQVLPHLGDWHHSDRKWYYSLSSMRSSGAGRYTAMVGYYCGELCSARIEYRVKKSGNSCTVISSSTISVS